ncbi:MAG TPA: TonB-dependent receptor [Vicinamibacterales bacterium]|nr:TonB-dependent receptor [Vicinamibacterales bacterium]
MSTARLVVWALNLLSIFAVAAEAMEGRVVDGRTGSPIAGAEVTIVGMAGSARTDADGRFTWKPDPKPPFVVVVVMPGGQLAKPIYIEKLDAAAVLMLKVDPAITEEVTVSGVAPSIDTSPGSALTLLSSREIALRAPANLMQSVENVPGVNQVSEGQAAVPAVRGLARGRTLILIDGSRVTSERRAGPSATFLDPSVVEGIDVARGPGSVAYGSDAFGGIISVRTRRPDYTGTKVDLSGTFGAGIPDRRGDVTFSKGFGSGGLLVAAHVRDVEDYRGPDEDVINSGWADRGFLVRAERRTGSGLLTTSWQSDFGRDIERPRNNSNSVRFYYPFENSHRFNTSFERSDVGPLNLLRISGYAGSFEQRTDQDHIPTATRPRDIVRSDFSAGDFQVRATGERAIGRARVEFGLDVNGRFGLEAHDIIVLYDLAGNVVSESDTVSIDSARRTDLGAFAQIDAPVGPKLSVAGGLRGDHVRNVNRGGFFGDRSVSNGAAAGLASVTAGPFANVTFTAQLSRGFRDPTLSDRFFRGPTGRGFITGNPDLEPETSVQLDLGARYASGRLRLAGYFYQYRIRNLVERFQTETDFFFFRNRGRAQIRGFEVESQAGLGRGYTLEVAGQVARGRALDDDTPLDDISPESISFVVRKAVTAELMVFGRVARYAEDDRPGPSEVAAPGHTNVDVGTSWLPSKRLEIRGSVRNLLNQEYYASPDPRFVLAPGVNGSVTVLVRF